MCDALQLNWKLNSSKSSSSAKSNNFSKGCRYKKDGKNSKSYTLRACSIKKRMETEHRKTLPKKRGPKPRPKSAPMSKYRRKTANLRERQRMGEINNAFERLRDKIPNPVLSGRGKCEKLTKINILHVAINYIRAMENLIDTGDSGIHSYSEMVRNPIRPNEKPTKFDLLDFSGEDTEPSFDIHDQDETGFPQQLGVKPQKSKKSSNRKVNKKALRSSSNSRSRKNNDLNNAVQDHVSSGDTLPNSMSSTAPYILPPAPSCNMPAPKIVSHQQHNNSITFYVTPSNSPLKTCLETSSDSGISSTSSSPTFLMDESHNSYSKSEEDPLLGSSIMTTNKQNPRLLTSQISNSTTVSINNPFDISLTDDVLKEVVGLVDTLQESDFPDITFEDPFELWPKNMQL